MKKFFSVILSIAMIMSCMVFKASAADRTMRFGSDHKFKIVVFADCQDDDTPYEKMITFMGKALDDEQPDMVVFTGDNVHITSAFLGKNKFKTGAQKLIKPLIDRDIPYAYTYGNHDAEKIDKDYQFEVYSGLGTCLTYNGYSGNKSYANCNIPIYSSSGNDVAFNLWIIDSNMYPDSGDGYDNVHQDQLDWFVRTDTALEQAQGHKVNSLVFQHIVVPEIYECLVDSPNGTHAYNGKNYELKLNSNAHGYLGEFPCPPNTNSGEFATLKNRGDVIGIVTGHDHSNSFVGTYQGIDFIQMPGMTFESYGDDNARGYGVIELDERDTTTYSSYTVEYTMPLYKSIALHNESVYDGYLHYNSVPTYISDIKCACNDDEGTAKNALTSEGYNVIEFDLNKGARGNYIFMGYKTTTNYEDAIKDIRFYSNGSNYGGSELTIKLNGTDCVYHKDGADLNTGSGGDYIFACYTKDYRAGAAITGISFATDKTSGTGICGGIITPDTPADLNNGTTTHNNAVYCYTSRTNTVPIDVSALQAKYAQLSPYLSDGSFSEKSMNGFNAKMGAADTFLTDIEAKHVTPKTSADLSFMAAEMMDSCARLTSANVIGDYIYNVPRTTAGEELAGRFNTGYANVSVQKSSDCMGTGSTVNISYENGAIQYKTVIFGDVNGDGWYDGQDAVIVNCLADGMLTESQVDGAAYIAADCNHDGAIDGDDVELLSQAALLLSEVDQTKSEEELLATSSAYVEYLGLIDQNPTVTVEEEEQNDCILSRIFKFLSTVAEYIVKLFKSIWF